MLPHLYSWSHQVLQAENALCGSCIVLWACCLHRACGLFKTSYTSNRAPFMVKQEVWACGQGIYHYCFPHFRKKKDQRDDYGYNNEVTVPGLFSFLIVGRYIYIYIFYKLPNSDCTNDYKNTLEENMTELKSGLCVWQYRSKSGVFRRTMDSAKLAPRARTEVANYDMKSLLRRRCKYLTEVKLEPM